MSEENWRPIPGWRPYEASSLGRIRNGFGHVMSLGQLKAGYRTVTLTGERRKWEYVHRLVLLAFVGERPAGTEGAHLNGIRHDNRPENLQWVTRPVNYSHSIAHGTDTRGHRNARAAFTREQTRRIRALTLRFMPAAIAKMYDVSPSTICNLRGGRTYAVGPKRGKCHE